jgi:multiple sugar transport system ATP-binding protein
MARIELDHITKVYPGAPPAVDDLSLDIPDGSFMVLVGPSGSGKSTALRMVAGLEGITSGEIRIGGRVVNDLPSKDRDIAMVFQTYALYPTMTVEENLAFSLEVHKTPKDEQARRVAEAARILALEPFLKRKPAALSGASASGWRWAARSCATRRRSCWTSPCLTWTPSCGCRRGRSWPPCTTASG